MALKVLIIEMTVKKSPTIVAILAMARIHASRKCKPRHHVEFRFIGDAAAHRGPALVGGFEARDEQAARNQPLFFLAKLRPRP